MKLLGPFDVMGLNHSGLCKSSLTKCYRKKNVYRCPEECDVVTGSHVCPGGLERLVIVMEK